MKECAPHLSVGRLLVPHSMDWVAIEHRAALVRAVVARDWGVACMFAEEHSLYEKFHKEPLQPSLSYGSVAVLPTPDDFVAELLGEKHDR